MLGTWQMLTAGIVVAATPVWPVLAQAQAPNIRAAERGWNPGSAYVQLYDPRNVETIEGIVVAVEKLIPVRGWSPGVSLLISVGPDKVLISVHLGPNWYLGRRGISFVEGDQVKVTGSPVTFQDNKAMMAREILYRDQTIALRNERGAPLWRAARAVEQAPNT